MNSANWCNIDNRHCGESRNPASAAAAKRDPGFRRGDGLGVGEAVKEAAEQNGTNE